MQGTKRPYVLLSVLLIVATTLALTGANQPAKPNQSDWVVVPDRTAIHVTLEQALASNRSKAGEHFAATVSQPVIVDGQTVIPKGARVEGLVADARGSGGLMGRARLQLALQSVEVGGQNYEIRTTSFHKVGGNHKKRNFAWIGGGAGGGLLIGALAAGGEGALIGGPVGAGAGTAVAFVTGRKNIKYPVETHLMFKLAEPAKFEVRG